MVAQACAPFGFPAKIQFFCPTQKGLIALGINWAGTGTILTVTPFSSIFAHCLQLYFGLICRTTCITAGISRRCFENGSEAVYPEIILHKTDERCCKRGLGKK